MYENKEFIRFKVNFVMKGGFYLNLIKYLTFS